MPDGHPALCNPNAPKASYVASRDKIKLLHWDTNGFWLYYKRLERGRFAWPEPGSGQQVLKLQARQLQWLLEGLALEQPRALKPVAALRVA